MGLLSISHLSTLTAVFFNLLPFVYFIYHSTHWYRPDFVRTIDLFLGLVSTVLLVALLLELSAGRSIFPADEVKIAVLHLLPLALTLLILLRGSNLWSRLMGVAKRGGAVAGSGKSETYKPVPI